jgi:hypothetical protein
MFETDRRPDPNGLNRLPPSARSALRADHRSLASLDAAISQGERGKKGKRRIRDIFRRNPQPQS